VDAQTSIATILEFPTAKVRAHWDRCAGEILKAAKTGKRSDIVEATRSIEVALHKENWL
jgi:hypothetical protein